jgi:hypothetical protein
MSTQLNKANTNKQCALCSRKIRKHEKVNLHHTLTLRSYGGQKVAEVHETCHRNHHKSNGDFAAFGRLSALDRHWAFYLKHVKDDPAHEVNRNFYWLYYSNPESRKELP